jgi:hypothetical protein
MRTHRMIFLTIGDLMSPIFRFAGQVKGRSGSPPPNEKSVRSRLLKPGRQATGLLLSRSRHLRDGLVN